MFLMGMGSVRDYARGMQAQAKIKEKNAGLFGGAKLSRSGLSEKELEKIDSVAEWFEQQNNYIESLRKSTETMQKNAPIEKIRARLKAGKHLTMQELEYLRRNAPELYRVALRIEMARDEHRKALERCQTKEEAQELHAAKMDALAAKGKGAAAVEGGAEAVDMEAAALQEEFEEFVESMQYQAMPDKEEEEKRERG